jgi:hypothetical protein
VVTLLEQREVQRRRSGEWKQPEEEVCDPLTLLSEEHKAIYEVSPTRFLYIVPSTLVCDVLPFYHALVYVVFEF